MITGEALFAGAAVTIPPPQAVLHDHGQVYAVQFCMITGASCSSA